LVTCLAQAQRLLVEVKGRFKLMKLLMMNNMLLSFTLKHGTATVYTSISHDA